VFFLMLSAAFAVDSNLRQALQRSDVSHHAHSIVRMQLEQHRLEKLGLYSQMAPVLTVDANWLYFGEPLDVRMMGESDIDCTSLDALGFGDLCLSMNEPMRLRDSRVFEAKIQSALPLTALYSLLHAADAIDSQYQTVELSLEMQRATVRVEVVNAYLDVLTLQNAALLSKRMSNRLQAKRDEVSAFVQQGLASTLDLDKLDNALAQSKMAERQSMDGTSLAQDRLNLIVGEPVVVSEFPDTIWKDLSLPKPQEISSHYMYLQALSSLRAAESAAKGAWGQAVPQVSLVAGMTKQTGQGQLTPPSQQFVGLNMSARFNWGNSIMNAKRADLNATMAKQSLDPLQKRLSMQIDAAQKKAEHAFMNLSIKEDILKTALAFQNQLQIEFEQQLKSATDLLDSETKRLSAELDVLKAKRDVLSAIAEYQAAAGLNVDPQTALGE